MAGPLQGGESSSAAYGSMQRVFEPVQQSDLEGIFAGGFTAPPIDEESKKRWPTVQLLMRAVLTSDGKPRAGGEIKTVASGPNYVSTLTMPEEGRMLRVTHELFGGAYDALERALMTYPIPWTQCSDFALKRAKIKKKPEDKKLLDKEEKRR